MELDSWGCIMKRRAWLIVAMFLFFYSAGFQWFAFKTMWQTGSFDMNHYAELSHFPIPAVVEYAMATLIVIASVIFLVLAVRSFFKYERGDYD